MSLQSVRWDETTTGAALQRPAPRKRDRAFGFAMALVVAIVIAIGAKGWIFGGMQ